ncbi:MAG: cbb3-type cytochrome oxidase assembly protein CcoS [Candidatus Dadabacteria bacterium]|nr:cbb3-type cytochrome oxidase assembly protein CcoS [Candidatus Dadabacteria bacterium]NIS07344.1 cbb3-type cytochrome oxidase assembly protein CcoS [Candidatus Dadabacteria bacterium]NIV41288.1 cbb3-type cytochrome oxidase assembly protein CcoS [Candidatus Dadabacteria bacterium]NIX14523.1 cbb3-type cytochrome oxidase assembly protein CcoS [Candidatus Dadabacteria bacterium]NIY20981.1 cbb3-type cytochrome oxidase assembly protein CcoS [Candidatus Dadabacteria bacterium]
MNIIFFTLGISLLLSLSFLLFFIWSTKKGQYDDLVTPSHRALLENEKSNRNLKTEDKINE